METCDADTLLRERRIRATAQRLAVLAALIEQHELLNAAEFHGLLGDRAVDLATVYRVLNLLREERLVREIIGNDGVSYYELACVHRPAHPHFKCTGCDRLFCLPSVNLGSVLRRLDTGGNRVDEVAVTFSGACKRCRQKSSA